MPHPLELLLGRHQRGARRDLGLEQHPQVVQVAERLPHALGVVVQLEEQGIEVVPLGDRADLHPAPVAHGDEPAGGECADHLARGRLRDAELGADVLLGRRQVVGADVAVDDPARRGPGSPGRSASATGHGAGGGHRCQGCMVIM